MLDVKDLHASYGPVPVLSAVNFCLADEEILSVLGRNGVGKTTLLRALIGLLPLSQGRIRLDEVELSDLPTHRIAKLGVAYVPQGRGIFPDLTVRENLLAGTRAQKRKLADIPGQVFEFFPILKERLGQSGGTLSGGEQQMLALGRALCGKPKVLLLDEPSEGIQPNIVQQLGTLIPEIARSENMSVLLVEQNFDLAMRMSNRCLIMDKGEIVYEGSPEELSDENLVKGYLAI